MARRTFDVVDIIEILVHWHAGGNKSEIAQSLGVDRKTAGKYIAAAVTAGMSPGGPPVSEERWAELAREWFPELADTRLRQVTWPAIEAHHDYIGEQLKAGVTVSTIHQRLRDERGLAVSVASLRRYVAANLPEETRRSQVKVLRPWPAEPGAEAQIDYGRLGRWLDPVGGKPVTIWAFVMVLACSRHLFVRPVIRLDQQGWSECHVAAFAFFGGVPARLVPEYVPRHIFRVLCPAALCGQWRQAARVRRGSEAACERHWPHNVQSEASQLRSDSSDRQMGLVRDPAEVPGGSTARRAASFVRVLISA